MQPEPSGTGLRWHRRALKLGCLLSINPDAHSVRELGLVRWGVAIARKGGVEKKDVLPPFNDDSDLNMVVETPRGSCVKLRFDPKMKVFSVCRGHSPWEFLTRSIGAGLPKRPLEEIEQFFLSAMFFTDKIPKSKDDAGQRQRLPFAKEATRGTRSR